MYNNKPHRTPYRTLHRKHHTTSQRKPTAKTIIGVVHAEWCGHCIQLMNNNWKTIEKKFNNDNSIKVISIEESDNSQTRINEINNTYLKNSPDKLTVDGYPTIFKITNKKSSDKN